MLPSPSYVIIYNFWATDSLLLKDTVGLKNYLLSLF